MSGIDSEPAAATAEGAEAPDSSGSTATPGCEITPPDMETEAKGDQEGQTSVRQSFLTKLTEEIAAYQKLEALYREGAIEIPEATRDAELLLEEKDLDKLLRQERMLELEYQLKLEQWSAWRQGKGMGAPGFDAGPGSAGGQLAVGHGFGRRREGRRPSLAGLKP